MNRPLAITRPPKGPIAPLYRMRWDKARYKWYGLASIYVGRTVEDVPDYVIAIYPVRQHDAHGPYMALYCIIDRDAETRTHYHYPNTTDTNTTDYRQEPTT